MSRSERLKGKGGELEAAVLLKNLLRDPTIHRVLDQPRDGGYDLDGDSIRHFAVEVKRTERANLRDLLPLT